MYGMRMTTLLAGVAASLSLSFAFWIFTAYGASNRLRLGFCSVCGAVATVWMLNDIVGYLPSWVTLLLMGQSVVGGATVLRNAGMENRRVGMPARRFAAVAQVTWFGFILGGTFGLGVFGLLFVVG